MKHALLVSCEHGGRRVPARYRTLFRGAGEVLASHRGWDPGALVLARELARDAGVPLVATETTRLLVDANRSLGSRALFSPWSEALPAAERRAVLQRWWEPHRALVEGRVRAARRRGRRVLHVSVHSFTPVWEGRPRDVDVGFLLDPRRPLESALVEAWRERLAARRPDLRLRRNRPYRGTDDGLTTTLRRRFGPRAYAGVELEVSQAFPERGGASWRALRADVRASLREALELLATSTRARRLRR